MSDDKQQRPVQDGRLIYASVSSMQKYDECARQWYYKYVLRLPDKPPSKGQARGSEGHARIQKFLTTGPDVLDELEKLGRQHMPAAECLVEHPIAGELFALDVPMVGYIDLAVPSLHIVRDWKFKKSIELYGARKGDLVNPSKPEGIQMLGYGAWLVGKYALADARLSHVTFQTQGRRDVEMIEDVAPAEEIVYKWDSIAKRIIPGMKAAAGSDVEGVKQNLSACSKYGGCPYSQACLDPITRIAQGFKKAAPEANLSSQLQLSIQQVAEKKMGFLKSVVSQVEAAAPVVSAPASVAEAPAPVVSAPASVAEAPAPVVSAPASVSEAPAPVVSAPVSASPAPASEPPDGGEAPKKPRGRPAGSTNKKDEAPSKASGVFLYQNCLPLGVVTQTLDAYVHHLETKIFDAIKAAGETPPTDLRLAEDKTLGFGKWKAHLADMAKLAPPAPGRYSVMSGDDRVVVVAHALASILEPGSVVIG